jgi:amino-acid N-acetyltransferase
MISSLTSNSIRHHAPAPARLEVRKARMSDIPSLLHLINDYASRGVMLPRTELEISESIRDFSVALADSQLAGCGALHFYSPTVGEVRSLAVAERTKTRGVGRRLIEALVNEATEYSLDAVFAFTYVTEFFRKVGFEQVERGALPLKAWKDCLRCPKFQSCDEVAVMRVLKPEHWDRIPRKWGQLNHPDEGMEGMAFPVILKHLP